MPDLFMGEFLHLTFYCVKYIITMIFALPRIGA